MKQSHCNSQIGFWYCFCKGQRVSVLFLQVLEGLRGSQNSLHFNFFPNQVRGGGASNLNFFQNLKQFTFTVALSRKMFLKITKFEALWTKFNNCPQQYFHYQKYRNEHAGFEVSLPLFVLTFTIFWMTVFTAKQFLIPARAEPCTHSSTHTPVHHLHAHSFPQPLYLRACNKHSKISVNLKGPYHRLKKIFI